MHGAECCMQSMIEKVGMRLVLNAASSPVR